MVAGSPIASKQVSGPPSVASRIAATVVSPSAAARTTSVAPTIRARSSLAATRSTATIRAAPAIAAPITQDNPTPPRPITATDDPARTSAVLRAAPAPVVTQQPIRAATSGGVPSGTGIAAAAGTFWRSANVPIAQYVRTSPPPARRSAARPLGIRCVYDGLSEQFQTLPARHDRQRPHGISQLSATRTPGRSPGNA